MTLSCLLVNRGQLAKTTVTVWFVTAVIGEYVYRASVGKKGSDFSRVLLIFLGKADEEGSLSFPGIFLPHQIRPRPESPSHTSFQNEITAN